MKERETMNETEQEHKLERDTIKLSFIIRELYPPSVAGGVGGLRVEYSNHWSWDDEGASAWEALLEDGGLQSEFPEGSDPFITLWNGSGTRGELYMEFRPVGGTRWASVPNLSTRDNVWETKVSKIAAATEQPEGGIHTAFRILLKVGEVNYIFDPHLKLTKKRGTG
ncbi:hypothetical protein PPSIR1_36779 [Plesiocystis pacifica SIR-1]|uniref:Uncharacterized protein n=2 Tax=Plesiocystis pacifica TaxID=191768 RepID=A6G0C1_9BACT|nr:hypothetical protein PPSIR1_36779 [Plesiocystis pacifica SIR-1]